MSRTMKDLTGMRFGVLTVLRNTGEKRKKELLWECSCDCGRIHIVAGCNLRGRNTRSCGKCGLIPRTGRPFEKGHTLRTPANTPKPKPVKVAVVVKPKPVKVAKPKPLPKPLPKAPDPEIQKYVEPERTGKYRKRVLTPQQLGEKEARLCGSGRWNIWVL